nr:lysophospholipid acyltransferase family protein [Nocardia cyriacigeorgica]
MPPHRTDSDQPRGCGRSGRGTGRSARILKDGAVWAIYPEGTRSPDGRLHRGRTGAMRVALQEDCSVVPVGIVGTRSINRPGKRGWRRGRVEIRIGAPIDVTRWAGAASNPNAWRAATDELMAAIQKLTGQEYVDRYPTSAERAMRDAA